MSDIMPCKISILREYIAVAHNFLMMCSLLIVDKIRYQHIQLITVSKRLFHYIEQLLICSFIYPVVTVNNLKKSSCGIGKPGIHRFAMPTVFLMYSLYNSRIFLCISVGDSCRVILCRTVIDNNNFNILTAF